MIASYLKTAWRNLYKYKTYSLLNVLGLALGICSSILILVIVQYELSYDRFNTRAERIYRVTFHELDYNPSVSWAVAPALRNDFPSLEAVSQVLFIQSGLVSVGASRFQEKGYAYADPYFFSIFDYSWLQGDPKTALAGPNAVVLTESLAHKYFGNHNPLGEVVDLENQHHLKVTGVIRDVPANTHLPFHFLVSWETIRQEQPEGAFSNLKWITGGSYTYILLPKNSSAAQLQESLPAFVKKNWGPEAAMQVHLLVQPLSDIHFDSRYLDDGVSYTTSRETYYALETVAYLILLIACINFVNMATAQAIYRAKEVGVRKVLGSGRLQLAVQFLLETALIVTAAFLLALTAVAVLLPRLSEWLQIEVSISELERFSFAGKVLFILVAIVLLSGIYPSWVQSTLNPLRALKRESETTLRGLTLRKCLVVTQFCVSQMLIIGTLVVAYQIDFFKNKDLGFDKEAVVCFSLPDQSKGAVLKNLLEANPGVRAISLSSGAPAYANNFTSFISPEQGLLKEDVTEVKYVDENYMGMFQLAVLAGDPVTKQTTSPDGGSVGVVVNETMIHKLGIQSPQRALGRALILNGNWKCTITGVVRDFQSESKHKKIRPCVLLYQPDRFYMVSVKLAGGSMSKTLSFLKKSWSQVFPDYLFNYEFLDDHIAAWYSQEQKEFIAFKLFSAVAIFIGCLGVYGLVAFASMRRRKEVGVRKVLGASRSQIVLLFSGELMQLIAVAFFIAAPLAYLVMEKWLQSFAYKISIGASIFLLAVLASLVIALGTVAYLVVKAASENPVKSLRTE